MPNNPLEGLRSSMGPQLQALKDHYQAARKGLQSSREDDPYLPYVPPPSGFQPDPFVVGLPEEARNAKELLDLDPFTKQRVKGITFGPTRGSMNVMDESSLPMDKFGGTNLLGVHSPESHQIGINPKFQGRESLNTMAHEIGHAAGWAEPGAEIAGNIMNGQKLEDPIEQLKKALTAKGIKFK